MHNTGIICPLCTKRKKDTFRASYTIKDIKKSDYIKVAVSGKDSQGRTKTENIWFQITRLFGETIEASLCNDPALSIGLRFGDQTSINFADIIDILKDEDITDIERKSYVKPKRADKK